jgi:hypothetical protein
MIAWLLRRLETSAWRTGRRPTAAIVSRSLRSAAAGRERPVAVNLDHIAVAGRGHGLPETAEVVHAPDDETGLERTLWLGSGRTL